MRRISLVFAACWLTGQWRTPEMDPMQVVSGPISRDRVRPKNIHFEAPTVDRVLRGRTLAINDRQRLVINALLDGSDPGLVAV